MDILSDALFAAIAAIGFAAISRPPRRAYLYCAIVAAIGHSARYILMNPEICGMNIIGASSIAAFAVGIFAVLLSPVSKMPAETCFFPALLPMIPGMYAYRSFGALALCLLHPDEGSFGHYFYLFASNAFTCCFVILGMVIGATLPIFLLKKISFQATR